MNNAYDSPASTFVNGAPYGGPHTYFAVPNCNPSSTADSFESVLDRCIVCLRPEDLTLSHVIPRSVGGRLAAPLECAGRNNRIGPQFESKLKLDPSIRLAVEELVETLPQLAARMRRLAPFVGSDGHVSVKGRWAGTGLRRA